MTEQEEAEKKRKSNRRSGILFVILGVIGVSSRFLWGNDVWRTVDYAKVIFSLIALGYGLYLIYKSKSPNTLN